MEKERENRVTEGLLDWTDKENRLSSVFGNNVIKGKDFLQSKRDFFNNLYQSCKSNASPEERMMLNVIKGETRKLDKLMYPNAAVRIIVKIADKVKEGIKSYRENRLLKNEMLSIQLKQKPLGYSKRPDMKGKENKSELHESAKEVLDKYKKKEANARSKSSDDQPSPKNENSLLPKRRANPINGRSIY